MATSGDQFNAEIKQQPHAGNRAKLCAESITGRRSRAVQQPCHLANAVMGHPHMAFCLPASHALPFSSPCCGACAHRHRKDDRTRIRCHTDTQLPSKRMHRVCKCLGNAALSPCCEAEAQPILPRPRAVEHWAGWEEGKCWLCPWRNQQVQDG